MTMCGQQDTDPCVGFANALILSVLLWGLVFEALHVAARMLRA